MTKITYSEKLKNPKWQKKRLEILQRDEFKCQCCGDEEKNLQIHHLTYNNCDPWEYETRHLITLCEDCHEKEEFLKSFTSSSLDYLATIGFLRKDIADIVSHISNKVDSLNDTEAIQYFKNLKKLIING